MNIRNLPVLAVAAVLTLTIPSARAFAQNDSGTKQSMKNAGGDTKNAAKETGHGIKQGTKKAYHKTARGTKKVGRKIEGKPTTTTTNPQ